MDLLKFFSIIEADHTFQNPTSAAKLDRFIEYCGIKDGQRVLDVGCGKGWLLQRMAEQHAIEGEGVEFSKDFADAGRSRRDGAALRGTVDVHVTPALDFKPEPGGYDVVTCVGASFAIGTFEEMLDWLRPCVKPGGVIGVGDIYARSADIPDASAKHFSGGMRRSITDTNEMLNRGGLCLTGLIDSSLDDWDCYESLHWRAAERWYRENPDDPDREAFWQMSEQFKMAHLLYDRDALGWALWTCRVLG